MLSTFRCTTAAAGKVFQYVRRSYSHATLVGFISALDKQVRWLVLLVDGCRAPCTRVQCCCLSHRWLCKDTTPRRSLTTTLPLAAAVCAASRWR